MSLVSSQVYRSVLCLGTFQGGHSLAIVGQVECTAALRSELGRPLLFSFLAPPGSQSLILPLGFCHASMSFACLWIVCEVPSHTGSLRLPIVFVTPILA